MLSEGSEGVDEEYAKALASYLALGVDKLADYNSVICVWHTTKGGLKRGGDLLRLNA